MMIKIGAAKALTGGFSFYDGAGSNADQLAVETINAQGGISPGRSGCDATDNSQCTCSSNRACLLLQKYTELPFFMRQAMRDYGLASPSMKCIY